MYEVGLRLAQTPSRYVLEALLDALAWHNAGWYLEQWEARRRPPKSAAAAGVRWTPDAPAVSAEFQDAPLVFEHGWASCGPIAAIAVGYARAVDRLRGGSLEHAHHTHRVVLRPQGRPGREQQWHAYHQAGERLVDPTATMRRV